MLGGSDTDPFHRDAAAGPLDEDTTAPPHPPWWRRVPLLGWAVTGVHIALMALCTVIYPPFTGYDESWHVDMTWSYYTGHGIYTPGGRLMDRGVEAAVDTVAVPPPSTPYATAPVKPRGDREPFGALNDGKPLTYPVPNQMVQHPPLYYLMEAGFLHAVPGGGNLPYDRQVWLMRLFSVMMMAPLPLLFWATANRAVSDQRVGVLAAMVPVTMPGLSRLGGSVNNDDLLILLCSALVYVLARVLTGDLRKRTGLLVGVLVTLALLTKGFALVLPLVVLAAYGVAWHIHRRRPLAPFGIAVATIAAFGSPWWVRNVVLYGAVQPSGLGPFWSKQIDGPARPGGTVQAFVPRFVRQLVPRIWGGFGLPDVPGLPQWTVWGWCVLLIVGALLGVWFGFTRTGRASAAVFLLPAVAILGVVFAGSLGGFLFNQRLSGVQGRYLYPGLAGLVVLAAWGWSRLAGRASRYLCLPVLLAGLLTQASAWRMLLLVWWAPRTGVHGLARARAAFDGVLRWSPWPVGATLVPFVMTVLLSLLLVGLTIRTVMTSGQTDAAAIVSEDGTSLAVRA